MDPLKFAGIDHFADTGDCFADAGALLRAHGKDATWRHVQAVADACAALARRFGLDEGQCRAAGILHDISAVIPPAEMMRYARAMGWALDAAEERYPFLLHQRLSAVIAEIECHTTLRAEASGIDMALFLADKIAWDQPGEPPFLKVIEDGLAVSLKEACRVYIDYVMDHGMILLPHQNLLAAREWLNNRSE